MKPSEFEIYFQVESYNEKTAENCRNCYDADKRIISKLLKISILNFDSTTQIEDFNQDCVKILRSYLQYFPRNKSSNS